MGFETNTTPGFLTFITCWLLTLTLIQLELACQSGTLAGHHAHTREKLISLLKIVQGTWGQPENKQPYSVRTYKLVTKLGMRIPDFNISFHIQVVKKWGYWVETVHKKHSLPSKSLQKFHIVRLFKSFGKYLSSMSQDVPSYASSPFPAECRWPESPCHMLGIHHILRERAVLVQAVKHYSQIYAYRNVPSGEEPNNSCFLKIAHGSLSVYLRVLHVDVYFHTLLIH